MTACHDHDRDQDHDRAFTISPLVSESLLKQALSDLSERLYRPFWWQVRLVVHGGAVMVLHPSFSHRDSTQDVDYIPPLVCKGVSHIGFSGCRTTTPRMHRGDRIQVQRSTSAPIGWTITQMQRSRWLSSAFPVLSDK